MKVTLKLSAKQLGALVQSFSVLEKQYSKERNVKVARSVLDKLVLKFKKKLLEVDMQPTLFVKPKKYNFSLEVYEAHFLELFVASYLINQTNDYDLNVLNFIRTTLNQQLA